LIIAIWRQIVHWEEGRQIFAATRRFHPQEEGPLPGTFRVEITTNRLTGEKVTTRFSSQPVELEETV
jgi:hypothetical protein|tara:strand:+ start:330 stop:530 length:201 start_codon:yes stop_codon:yes gene_type:complete